MTMRTKSRLTNFVAAGAALLMAATASVSKSKATILECNPDGSATMAMDQGLEAQFSLDNKNSRYAAVKESYTKRHGKPPITLSTETITRNKKEVATIVIADIDGPNSEFYMMSPDGIVIDGPKNSSEISRDDDYGAAQESLEGARRACQKLPRTPNPALGR